MNGFIVIASIIFGIIALITISLFTTLYKLGKKIPFVIKNKYLIFLVSCLITGIVQKIVYNYINNSNQVNINSNRLFIYNMLSLLTYVITICSFVILFYK
jgi:hypothetical protein